MKMRNKIIAGLAVGALALGLSVSPANATAASTTNTGASAVYVQRDSPYATWWLQAGQTYANLSAVRVTPGQCVTVSRSDRRVPTRYCVSTTTWVKLYSAKVKVWNS